MATKQEKEEQCYKENKEPIDAYNKDVEEKMKSHNINISFKIYLKFLKNYFTLISFSVVSLLLMFDYFIFTDVLNLNQALFFNYLIGTVAQEQPLLLIFVLIPIIFNISVVTLLYRIQYDFLNYFFNEVYVKAYKILSKINFLLKLVFIFFSILFIIFGDIIIYFIIKDIYNFFKDTNYAMNSHSLNFTIYSLYILYNISVLTLLLIVSSKLIIKIRKVEILTFILGFLFSMKLGLYTLIQFIPPLRDIALGGFIVYIIFNFAFFIPSVIFIVSKKITYTKLAKKKFNIYLSKIIGIVILIVAVNIFIYNLSNIYSEPYNNKKFWDKIPNNSLVQANLSLLLSPLKILKDNTFNLNFKDIEKKYMDKYNSEINILESTDTCIYFIPFKKYRILFITNKKLKKVITSYILIKEGDKISKIYDVGYINLKEE